MVLMIGPRGLDVWHVLWSLNMAYPRNCRSGLMSRMGRVFALTLGSFILTFSTITSARGDEPVKIAVLNTSLQNDHAQWVPTTEAELLRLTATRDTVQSMLEASGHYTFTDVSPSLQETINKGQKLGACAGCEVRYGKEINVNQVIWVEVQKVSELILNMNVYVTDVDSGQAVFGKSVDFRGNTDESWHRAVTYLLKNYFLAKT